MVVATRDCSRCGRLIVWQHGEPLCLACGELTLDPAPVPTPHELAAEGETGVRQYRRPGPREFEDRPLATRCHRCHGVGRLKARRGLRPDGAACPHCGGTGLSGG